MNQNEKESPKILGEEEYERAVYLVNSGHFKESIPLFHKAANLNYPPSFLWIYSLSVDKNETQKWRSKVQANFNWYQSKAQDGKPDSLFNLGYCFHEGIGTAINLEKAVELYNNAAERGFAGAQNNLGFCYENGEGVPQDWKKAVEFYTKAVEKGIASAQYNLACCYYKGEGVPQDLNKAIEYFSKSAEQGDTSAQFKLGVCYENGQGVSLDIDRAIQFYSKAAEQGDANAQNNLGVCYSNGDGVPKDINRAVELYTKAAEQGNAGALFNLGVCYKNGKGVPQDIKKAIELYRKSAEQGYTAAKNFKLFYDKIDVQVIVDIFKDNRTITQLCLKGNQIRNSEVQAIANCLKVDNTLTELTLNDDIGDSGTEIIADALKIKKFTIKGNPFDDISKLGEALKCNKSLTELIIDEKDSSAKELEKALEFNICLLTIKQDPENAFESFITKELLKRNDEIQMKLSKRIFKCKNTHLSLLDYKILERVNVAVIFENVWELHQTQQTGKTYEECLKEYWKLISLNTFSKNFLFILGVCKLNQIPPSRSHLLGIPKEILNYIGSFLNPKDCVFVLKEKQ